MMRQWVRLMMVVCLLLAGITGAIAQMGGGFPGTKSSWKGFARYDFQFEGRNCRVVCPDTPAGGNPWVWNARFPDWHTDTDSILLSEGFFVTYIDTDELIGSPKAVAVWDQYYSYLINNHNLSKKVALEGVSRGGLYVYNFAKRYPWRISCIYAEAPVMDFKSWPGAFTGGKRSDADWKLILEMYGFRDDAEALAWRDNPVDNLEGLARAKVPVLHMIGLNDQVVPPELNTFAFLRNYTRLGGVATVVPCTRGPQDLEGHHFVIETPRLVADFIKYNTPVLRQPLDPTRFHANRDGIARSLVKFRSAGPARVAFLGGSITWGAGWRDQVCSYLQETFPECGFEFINAGIPSMGSTPGAFRLQKDVLSHGLVDLLFVEAAVNDRTNLFSDDRQIRAMEGIVRHARKANPAIDIVFMHFADPEKLSDYNSGKIPAEIANHEKVAAHYRIPSINLAREVTDRINAGEFSWEEDFIDLHPSPFGHSLYFNSIRALIEKNQKSIKVDAAWQQPTTPVLPAPIDPFCYDRGYLVEAGNADINKSWNLVPGWKPADGKGTRADYTGVPMLLSTKPGEVLTCRFEGRTVGIAVAAGPDAGIIEYRVDGSDWAQLDLFTPWSGGLHLPWFFTLRDDLKPGRHKLDIRLLPNHNPQSAGTACRIRYFFFNP